MIFSGDEGIPKTTAGATTTTPSTVAYTNYGALLVDRASVQASKITVVSYNETNPERDDANQVNLVPHPITRPRS
jgi:hypothetical protein